MHTPNRSPRLSLRRYAPALILALLGTVLSVAAFLREGSLEQDRLSQRFEHLAAERAAHLQSGIDRALESLYATSALFDASDEVTRTEFDAFPEQHDRSPSRYPWHRMATTRRRRCTCELRGQGARRGLAEISRSPRMGENRTLIPATPRAEYFPVFYTVPFARNSAALGFDSYSQADNDTVMDASRDTGAVLATAAFTLVQDTQDRPSTVIYHPIYRTGTRLPTRVAERRQRADGLRGSAIAYPGCRGLR